jgi:hypothetical protein
LVGIGIEAAGIMKLESAREAKAAVLKDVLEFDEIASFQAADASTGGLGYRGDVLSGRFNETRAMQLRDFHSRALISVGIELTEGRKHDASLVILCQSRRAFDSERADRAIRAAKGEARKVLVGPVRRSAPSRMDIGSSQTESAPLRIGSSLGHRRVTAGTLGCFVHKPESGICALSNNHILANTNSAALQDPIISPARSDGGRDPTDRCGALYDFIPLNLDGVSPNRLDCAVATISLNRSFDPSDLTDHITGRRVGRLKAQALPTEEAFGLPVAKIGRTTGLTVGEVVAIELDGVRVMMDSKGYLRTALFNGQMVVASRGSRFSKGGDSGSVVFSHPGEQAVGLLFAGADRPYGDEFGAPTFANPMDLVLAELRCDVYVG